MVTHTSSWYAASLPAHLDRVRPPLDRDIDCDVCVVGGGFAGVSAAYHLAKAGKRVVLLEAQRVGWGASGRNGGQIHPGFRKDLSWFDARMGRDVAQKVHHASLAALDHLDDLINDLALPCHRTNGLLTASRSQSDLDEEMTASHWAAKHFGAKPLQHLSQFETAKALGTEGHVGAVRDQMGGHIHPLAFVTGLAEAAEAHGAEIFDQTHVTRLEEKATGVVVHTQTGKVRAGHVVLCGNGIMRGLDRQMDARVLPITNFVVATKPIGAGKPGGILPFGDAAADTRFIVRYWRPTFDGRLVFGGGEKFSTAFPKDIEAFVRPHLAEIYPQLAEVQIDHAWGGTLAVTQNRLPLIRKTSARVTVAAGFSGQGVVNAPFAGKIVADSLTHDPSLLDLVSRFPCPAFPGSAALRGPILFMAMSYFALRDRLGA